MNCTFRGSGYASRILTLCIMSTAAHIVSAQENAETLIDRCRRLATSGQRADAIQELGTYLSTSDNGDARVLLGQVLSWEGRYDEARVHLETVLATSKDHSDAFPAMVNIELWSGHPERALALIDDALTRNPQRSPLLLGKAKALQALNEISGARDLVSRLLQIDPGNADGLQMRSQLYEEGRKLESSISRSSEWFNDGTKPWHETQLTLKQESSRGSLIARFSQADRFSMTSRQSEVEFYPHIRAGTYMYFGAGYSSDRRLYPRLRSGAEIFQSAGKGFEVSAGLRSMSFGERVTIYTASLGKYRGNWYYSVRTFLTPGTAGISNSLQFQGRRYFGRSGTDYIGLRFGRGSSPVEIRSVQDTTILKLNSFGLDYHRRVTQFTAFSARIGFSREDRLHRSQLLHYYGDVGLSFRF
jgi:YaiO family outer membrane protein